MHAEAEGFVAGLRTCFGEVRGPGSRDAVSTCSWTSSPLLSWRSCAAPRTGPTSRSSADAAPTGLRGFLTLPNGIPSHDTFRRVFGLLERQQFSAGLFRWTRALDVASGGKLIALDGKTARALGSQEVGVGGLALGHRLGYRERSDAGPGGPRRQVQRDHRAAGVAEVARPAGAVRRPGTRWAAGRKSPNRSVGGRGITCRPSRTISRAGPRTWRRLFADGIENDFAGLRHTISRTEEKGHGRHERRTCEAIGIPADHPQRSVWKQLSTLVVVTSCRGIGDKETWETRY